jgi:hypothetical protein
MFWSGPEKFEWLPQGTELLLDAGAKYFFYFLRFSLNLKFGIFAKVSFKRNLANIHGMNALIIKKILVNSRKRTQK